MVDFWPIFVLEGRVKFLMDVHRNNRADEPAALIAVSLQVSEQSDVAAVLLANLRPVHLSIVHLQTLPVSRVGPQHLHIQRHGVIGLVFAHRIIERLSWPGQHLAELFFLQVKLRHRLEQSLHGLQSNAQHN